MPDMTRKSTTLADGLDGSDLRTLKHVFQHRLSHNLSLRMVTGLFDTIGNTEAQLNGDIHFHLGDEALTLKRPRGMDLTATEVMELRHLLTRHGWSPDAPAAPTMATSPATTANASDLAIIIDHQGANVYHLTGPDAPQYLPHEVNRTLHDADREETYPADTRFFDEVARASAGADRIVLIGHGKGQSNEADHLSDYLRQHHKDLHARIVTKIVADLTHMQTRQLLDLGRHALTLAGDAMSSTPNGV